MPMEYIVPSLIIVVITKMTDVGTIEEIVFWLVQLEEDIFVPGYHQNVENERHKSWHNKHVKYKQFQIEDLVFLYDSKV